MMKNLNAPLAVATAYTYLIHNDMDLIRLENLKQEVTLARKAKAAEGKTLGVGSKVIKDYKAALPEMLPFDTFSILLGHMLGDGSVEYAPSTNSARMRFEWANKEYAWHIYNLLSNYVLTPPRVRSGMTKAGNPKEAHCFNTIMHPSLSTLHHLFMVNGVKMVPVGLIEHLMSPLALAIWSMDDGQLVNPLPGKGKTLHFHTGLHQRQSLK